MNKYFMIFFSVGFSVGVYLMDLTHTFLWHKNNSAAKWAVVASLMFLILYIKDFICYYYFDFIPATHRRLQMMTISEVPFDSVCAYFVCRELVQPGWSRWYKWLLHVAFLLPFSLAYILYPGTLTLLLAYAVQVSYLVFATVMVLNRRALFLHSLKNEYTEGNFNIKVVNSILILYLILVVAYIPTYFVQYRAEVMIWYLVCPLIWTVIVALISRYKNPETVEALLKTDDAHGRGTLTSAFVTSRKYPFEKELKNLFTIEKMYHNPHLTLSDIANKLKLERNDLTDYLRDVPKTSFNEYVNSYRVKEAERDIVNGGMTLEAIGAAVGFENSSSFITAFKRVHNCTPLSYKCQLEAKRKNRVSR